MLTLSSPVNRTVNMLTRTHATTSLGDTDEVHTHVVLCILSVDGVSITSGVVSSIMLLSVNETTLYV